MLIGCPIYGSRSFRDNGTKPGIDPGRNPEKTAAKPTRFCFASIEDTVNAAHPETTLIIQP
jgi:hypothetical protein